MRSVVAVGKVVPVRPKSDEVFEIIGPRGLEDASNERLFSRLCWQSDKLDGSNKVTAGWV